MTQNDQSVSVKPEPCRVVKSMLATASCCGRNVLQVGHGSSRYSPDEARSELAC